MLILTCVFCCLFVRILANSLTPSLLLTQITSRLWCTSINSFTQRSILPWVSLNLFCINEDNSNHCFFKSLYRWSTVCNICFVCVFFFWSEWVSSNKTGLTSVVAQLAVCLQCLKVYYCYYYYYYLLSCTEIKLFTFKMFLSRTWQTVA